MATQLSPTYQPMTHPATAPVLRRRLILHKRAPRPGLRPAARMSASADPEKQRLLVEMLPLVKRLAYKIRQHLPAHVEVDDLIANGVLGLVDAVAKFDTAKRVKLESYARHRVRGAILDGLRGADPASRDMRRKNKRIQLLYRELEVKLGRPVTDEEMAAAVGISLANWHRTLREVQSVGFDFGIRPISAGPTSKRLPTEPTLLADHEANPFELCYRREQREILTRALSHLPERERGILTFYYYEELTMKQIADRLNVDESRVSQLHSAALVRLKSAVESMLRPPHTTPSEVTATLSMAAGSAA
jgi:RNA polymerase sigma factor for flagellar operon FliA